MLGYRHGASFPKDADLLLLLLCVELVDLTVLSVRQNSQIRLACSRRPQIYEKDLEAEL